MTLQTIALRKRPTRLAATSIKGVRVFPKPPTDFNIRLGAAGKIDYGLFFPLSNPGKDKLGTIIRSRVANWNLHTARVFPEFKSFTRPIIERPFRYRPYINSRLFLPEGNWTGAALGPIPSDPWTSVTGTWIVPTAVTPFGITPLPLPPSLSPYASGWQYAAWIGLDGLDEQGSTSADVVQTGVTSIVDSVTGEATYFPWYEWFPQPPIKITNLTVSPGDMILATINYAQDKSGAAILFANLSTRRYFSIFLDTPFGVHAAGDSMEWIVERPGGPSNSLLPDFGILTFTPGGSAANGSTVDLNNAIELTFLDPAPDGFTALPTQVQIFNDSISICYSPATSEMPPIFNKNGS